MTVSISAGTPQSVRHVVEHMRESDRIEISATTPNMDPDELTSRIMLIADMVFVARHNDVPASCWGLMPMWPGVGYAFCFGTDDWGAVLLAMTRHVRRFMVPLLLDTGFHRVETRSLATRQDVGRWLEIFGAEAEAVMRGSGARGEDFILYSWLSDEHRSAQIKNAPGNHDQAGEPRGRRRAHHARHDTAAREPDLPAALPVQSIRDIEISARRYWERCLSAHRGNA
jgi:hypothetical protein